MLKNQLDSPEAATGHHSGLFSGFHGQWLIERRIGNSYTALGRRGVISRNGDANNYKQPNRYNGENIANSL
jgi:hypothetical protein